MLNDWINRGVGGDGGGLKFIFEIALSNQ